MQPASQPCGQPPHLVAAADRTDLASSLTQQPPPLPSQSLPVFCLLGPRLDLDLDLDLDVDLNLDLPGAKFKIPIVSEGELCSVSIQYQPMQNWPSVCLSLTGCNNTSARKGSTTLRTATTANQPADPVPAARPCLAFSCRRSKQIGLVFARIVGGVGMGVGTLQPPPGATSLASLASPHKLT
jgi:hypothetical protein